MEMGEAGDDACFGRCCWPVSGEGDWLLLWSGLFIDPEREVDGSAERGEATGDG